MNRSRIAPYAVLGLLAGAALESCASAPTRIWTPYAVPSAAAIVAYPGPAVHVDGVRLPPALERSEVLTTLSPGEMTIHDSDHWSAPPVQLAAQVLAADLIARLPPGRVGYPHLPKTEGMVSIIVDVLAFEVLPSGTATLQASWLVVGTTGVAGPPTSVRVRTAFAGASSQPAVTVDVFSTLLGSLADRIASGLMAPPGARL